VAFAAIVVGLLVGPATFGLLLVGANSYVLPWAVFAGLAALVTVGTLVAGPAIDRERGYRDAVVAWRSMSARVAVVGDFNARNRTHAFTDAALEQLDLGHEWVPTDAVPAQAETRLSGYAGLWIAPASPYRSMEGALAAVRYARERGVPLVGT
jgi:CTP synthase (UTP-ammonia lyase)